MLGDALYFDAAASPAVYVAVPFLINVASNFTFSVWVIPTTTVVANTQANSSTVGTSGQHYVIDPPFEGGTGLSAHAGAGLSVGTNGVFVV